MDSWLDYLWKRYNSHKIAPILVSAISLFGLLGLTALISDIGFSDEVTSNRWMLLWFSLAIAGVCACIWLIIANKKKREQLRDAQQKQAEKLQLLEQELAKLKQYCSDFKRENSDLLIENSLLKNENQELRKTNQNLDDKLNPKDFAREAETILLTLSDGHPLIKKEIAEETKLNPLLLDFYIDDLRRAKLIYEHPDILGESTYSITQAGRRYVLAKFRPE